MFSLLKNTAQSDERCYVSIAGVAVNPGIVCHHNFKSAGRALQVQVVGCYSLRRFDPLAALAEEEPQIVLAVCLDHARADRVGRNQDVESVIIFFSIKKEWE